MAQTQCFTNEGIGELIKLLQGTAATKLAKIAGMTDTTACAVNATNTYAAPIDTMSTHNGLATVAITTIALATSNTAGDSVDFDHVFTATAAEDISGIMVMNNEATPDVLYVECCFNAYLAMESDDTLTIDGRVCIDQA